MSTHSLTNCHRVDGADAFFVRHGYTQVPHLVQWMATLQCGLRCAHCLAAGDQAGQKDMPLQQVKALIDEVADLGVREFLLTGGEPLVREDLVEVIAYLGHRRVNWSLNTAALPEPELRQVISQHRPGFVAVSLDGPRAVHDEFRGKAGAYEEALASIRFFKSLRGVRTCAGTTVTAGNYDCLDETFHLAVGSGADQWGIHLLVPEGRAAGRRDLFLSRSQLKRLIKFVGHKRRYFNVQMADEIGYLGLMEPSVRDRPMTCGAGRSQCVILPDGSVLPCTTLDRAYSAGNLREQSLQEIWKTGFQDLRSWRAQGKCAHCDYASACKGACWLQRKAGTQCYKDVWHVPGALKSAAGIAICLGGMAVTESTGLSQDSPLPGGLDNRTGTQAVTSPADASGVLALDTAIMDYYVSLFNGKDLDIGSISGVDWNDPGWAFFGDLVDGTLPGTLTERCSRIHEALDTEQRSLSLASLCWRILQEPRLDVPESANHTELDRMLIRDTLFAIHRHAMRWRQEIFVGNLDPFLGSGRYVAAPSCNITKGDGPGFDPKVGLSRDLNVERWGIGTQYDCMGAAEAFYRAHPVGDQMNLIFSFFTRGQFIRHSVDGQAWVRSHVDNDCTGEHTIGVFDVIEAQEDIVVYFKIKGLATVCGEFAEDVLLNDAPRELILRAIPVYLEAGREYTYAELTQAIHAANRDWLMELACAWLSDISAYIDDNTSGYRITSIHQNAPLLWPAMRKIIRDNVITYQSQRRGEPQENIVDTHDETLIHRRAVLKDVDWWMF